MTNHHQLGKEGEACAVNYLKKLHYEIVATNWRSNKYEIDIIAIDNNEMVFVEVKTRRSAAFGNPEEAIHIKKQQHLLDGASHYLEVHEIDLEARFDVIAIVKQNGQFNIRHIKNAFSAWS